jgi:hypothetical protein
MRTAAVQIGQIQNVVTDCSVNHPSIPSDPYPRLGT